MALRDQPYIPLYVKDILTDEKLKECSVGSHGVYLLLMCLLHKQEVYGAVKLNNKYKDSGDICYCFATMFDRHMPFSLTEIESGLTELLMEDVIQVDGDVLSQKRMINDGDLSKKRALAGSSGGKKKQENIKNIPSKCLANSETAYVNENEDVNEDVNEPEDVKDIVPVKPKKPKKEKEPKIQYANNVLMTVSEYNQIITKYFNGDNKLMDLAIDKLDSSKLAHDYKYKSDAGAIRTWVAKQINKDHMEEQKLLPENKHEGAMEWIAESEAKNE